jgi:hypothetical protein
MSDSTGDCPFCHVKISEPNPSCWNAHHQRIDKERAPARARANDVPKGCACGGIAPFHTLDCPHYGSNVHPLYEMWKRNREDDEEQERTPKALERIAVALESIARSLRPR